MVCIAGGFDLTGFMIGLTCGCVLGLCFARFCLF
jgi:hypothetical protein